MSTRTPISAPPGAPDAEVADLLRAALERDGNVRWVARGWSMGQAMPDGTVVVLHPVLPGLIRRGAVVMAELPDGRLVLHRVVRVRGDGVVFLWGDRNRRPDPPVRRRDILGVVYPAPPADVLSRLHHALVRRR